MKFANVASCLTGLFLGIAIAGGRILANKSEVVTGDSPYFEQFAFGAVPGGQTVSRVEFADLHTAAAER